MFCSQNPAVWARPRGHRSPPFHLTSCVASKAVAWNHRGCLLTCETGEGREEPEAGAGLGEGEKRETPQGCKQVPIQGSSEGPRSLGSAMLQSPSTSLPLRKKCGWKCLAEARFPGSIQSFTASLCFGGPVTSGEHRT